MNEQKQTKRANAKKIGAYVLIGILVCVLLVSTLGNALSASADDILQNLTDVRELSSVYLPYASAIGADYLYSPGVTSIDSGTFVFDLELQLYEEDQIDYHIIVMKDDVGDFIKYPENEYELVDYFRISFDGVSFQNAYHAMVYEYDTFYDFVVTYSVPGCGYDVICFDYLSCFLNYIGSYENKECYPLLFIDYQNVIIENCDYDKLWFDTTFTYENGVMRNELEYIPLDMTNESYYILVEDKYNCFGNFTSDDGTIDVGLMEIIDSEFYGKISSSDTKYVLTNHMRGIRVFSYERNIYAFYFRTQYADSYFTYFGVEFGNIFNECGWGKYLDGLSVLGVAVLEDAFPDHTIENAVLASDDIVLSGIKDFQAADMKLAYMCNADYKLDYAPEKTNNELIWKLPARLIDVDYIDYSIVYDLDDLEGFDLSFYNSDLFSEYFYGIIYDDGVEYEFSDIVNITVKDGYLIATFRCTSFERGFRYVGFKWKDFFEPWLSDWNNYDVVIPLGFYVNYANTTTEYPSTDNYRTYAERVIVYGDNGAEKTQIKGFQNGNKFICDYVSVFVDTNGKPIIAQDIMVKGWLVVNGGVDYYSYTLKNGIHEVTHEAINMFADDFITSDVDKIGADGGYVCYNYNTQYQFCISRLFDPAYRGTDIDSIEIKAHLYDGTVITIFTINNVWLSEHGGFRCGECGNRLIKNGEYVSLSHDTHQVDMYCDVCCEKRVATFNHYITDDKTNICNLCGGSGRFCTRFVNDVYSPVGLTYHERYTVCADCGKESTYSDSHVFNNDKVCVECGYVYYNYATYDEGYSDGYSAAFETMEYGYFVDARLTVFARVFDNFIHEEKTLKKDYLIDNVSKGGLSFEKYVDFLITNKNINVLDVEIVIEFTQPMEYFDGCLLFTSTLVDGEPFLPIETSLVAVNSGDRITCEYKQASLTHSAIIADGAEKFYIQKIRFTVPTMTSENLYTAFYTRELRIVSNVILLGAKNAYYNEGYSDGLVSAADEIEQSYNDGYQYGFSDGEEQGYIDGFVKGQNSDNVFKNLFSGMFDSMTQTFFSMLNFEIFGINLASVILGVITILLSIAVIAFVKRMR